MGDGALGETADGAAGCGPGGHSTKGRTHVGSILVLGHPPADIPRRRFTIRCADFQNGGWAPSQLPSGIVVPLQCPGRDSGHFSAQGPQDRPGKQGAPAGHLQGEPAGDGLAPLATLNL